MNDNYKKLGIVLSINTVVMFVLTYSLIDRFAHFVPNVNRLYMALIMVAPMAILMLIVMRSMYTNVRLNAILFTVFGLIFFGAFTFARAQIGVGNEQFLKSMIPHHSSAILMCENPSIDDPEIVELCEEIIEAQEREIRQMEAILERY